VLGLPYATDLIPITGKDSFATIQNYVVLQYLDYENHIAIDVRGLEGRNFEVSRGT